jgi:hypothetical protein
VDQHHSQLGSSWQFPPHLRRNTVTLTILFLFWEGSESPPAVDGSYSCQSCYSCSFFFITVFWPRITRLIRIFSKASEVALAFDLCPLSFDFQGELEDAEIVQKDLALRR